MKIQISSQCLYFFLAWVLGYALGLCYEPLRLLRTAFPHKPFLIALEDILFCLASTFCVICLCYALGRGTVRWFALAGIGLGLYFYFLTLGRFLKRCSSFIIAQTKRFFMFLHTRFLLPFLRFLRRLLLFWHAQMRRVFLTIQKKQALRYDTKIRKALSKRAQRGFRYF